MKRILKKALATSLAAAMLIAPMNVYAMKDVTTTAETTVKGDNLVTNPIYKVSLPTSVAFTIDALELGEKGQVYASDFAIVNRSNVPVFVNAAFFTTLGTKNPATLVDKDATIETAIAPTKKEAYIYVNPAKDHDTGSTVDAVKTEPKFTYDADEVMDLKAAVDKDTAVEIFYLLDKATYDDKGKITAVAQADSVGGFTIGGAVTTYAEWAAKDISVSAVFKFQGLGATDWTNYTTNSASDANGLNSFTALSDQ